MMEMSFLTNQILQWEKLEERDMENIKTRLTKLERIDSHIYEYAILSKLVNAAHESL